MGSVKNSYFWMFFHTATKYIKRIKDLNLIIEVKGKGYGRYIFIKEYDDI